MRIRSLPVDYALMIVKKKKIFKALIRYGLDTNLIRKAIHYMPVPPYECHEIFFEIPRINMIKEDSPDEYTAVVYAMRALSQLLNNPIPNSTEKESLNAICKRISLDYEIDLTDRKALYDSFRSEREISRIEDYADYPDKGFGWSIDKNLNTQQQCEDKLITILYEYIKPFVDIVNERMPISHQKDYKQKDTFELIAEILNLRWHGKYDYMKIRNGYRNFKTFKPRIVLTQ
jgi:hypothetical protein